MAELKRSIGFWTILALAVCSIAGTGLFLGSALGAKISGTSSIISWIILSVIAVYVAACFGELVAMFPKAGGVYEYTKQAYGRFISFIMGWIAWLVTTITTTLLVVAAIEYLTPTQFPLVYKIAISIAFIVLLNIIAYIGIEASSLTLIVLTAVMILVVAAVTIFGVFQVNLNNFHPFLTHPFTLVLVTVFFITESLFGWESATYLSEETKDPEKVIPKAIITGTIIVVLLNLAIVFITFGLIPWQQLAGISAPLNTVASMLFGNTGMYIISIGVYLALLGAAAGGIVSAPRLLLALARDKLFLAQFSDIHTRFRTPYKAIIFQTIIGLAILFAGWGKYDILLSILVPLALIMYIMTLLAIPILRLRRPELKRPFKVFGAKYLPIIVSIFFAIIIVIWAVAESQINLLMLALSFIALGLPIYFLLEMYYNPKMIQKVNDFFSRIAVLTEDMSLPKRVRREILVLLGSLNGKKVLEFGCNVGTFTKYLARSVGGRGVVYATSPSKKQVGITNMRIAKEGHKNVRCILEKDRESVNKKIVNIDVAVSIGVLGYLQNVKKALKQINTRLDKGDKILFLEYDKFFWFIPNTAWLNSDDHIKHIFNECGFSVSVVRKQGIFWQYIYIYGIKKKDVRL